MTTATPKDEKLASSVFFIEATDFERLMLWNEFQDKQNWEHDSQGFWRRIGCIDANENKPVCVSFSFIKLYGKRICFYEVTSRFSDSQMVENWLDANYEVKWDGGTRIARADAMNFRHAIDCCWNDK